MDVKTYEELFKKKLLIKDLTDMFIEDTKTGKVTAFGGKLNIRPAYQREFIYGTEEQQAVIDTIMKGYPLNVMYWAKCDDGTYELMDGQQRTLSICKFHDVQQIIPIYENGQIRQINFDEFTEKQKKDFENYPLTIYICDGTEKDKIAWFRTINIAGIKLTEQEMRNAIYISPWVIDAKKYFSNIKGKGWSSEGNTYNGYTYGDYTNCIGGKESKDENAVVRQKLLEKVLSWAVDKYNKENDLSGKNAIKIDDYMRINKNKPNAIELWRYYEDVMEWVKATFPTYRKIMQDVEWGKLYNEFGPDIIAGVNDKVNEIMLFEDEISNTKKVYEAILSNNFNLLNARSFNEKDKKWAYEKQKHICPYCKGEFNYKEMHGDHIVPWSKGGKTERDNLQMLCAACNIKKSAYDVKYVPWEKNKYKEFILEDENKE